MDTIGDFPDLGGDVEKAFHALEEQYSELAFSGDKVPSLTAQMVAVFHNLCLLRTIKDGRGAQTTIENCLFLAGFYRYFGLADLSLECCQVAFDVSRSDTLDLEISGKATLGLAWEYEHRGDLKKAIALLSQQLEMMAGIVEPPDEDASYEELMEWLESKEARIVGMRGQLIIRLRAVALLDGPPIRFGSDLGEMGNLESVEVEGIITKVESKDSEKDNEHTEYSIDYSFNVHDETVSSSITFSINTNHISLGMANCSLDAFECGLTVGTKIVVATTLSDPHKSNVYFVGLLDKVFRNESVWR